MLQIRTAQLLFEHLEYSSVFSLVLKFGFSRLSKVYYTRFEYIFGNFTAVKAISASAIRTITKLLTVHKLWVKYFFAHRGHLFMMLISESSCGRQNVSLKIVIRSRVFLYRCIFISVNKAGISLLFYTYLPIAIFHGRWITLSSLAHTYVDDLHLIVSKFKAIC